MNLTGRERSGLVWLRGWARCRVTHFKKSLKYQSHRQALNPRERAHLTALISLEKAAGELLSGVENEP